MTRIKVRLRYGSKEYRTRYTTIAKKQVRPEDTTQQTITQQIREDVTMISIKADGLSVLDDVGGIHGYCDFLAEIREGTEDEKNQAL